MAEQGGRKFHEQFPTNQTGEDENEENNSNNNLTTTTSTTDNGNIFKFIQDNVIGKDLLFNGPFGKRRVIHCDYTASARSLRYIEDYIRDVVLPHYGNSHTTTSVTSLQTTMFTTEARDIVRNSVNASENDAVVFVGSGCTAAVHKLIHALKLDSPPVVFVGPYEHHSNLLPWKEIGGHIVWTSTRGDGSIDLTNLERNLKTYQGCGRPLIGCFSAASNVTGMLVDTDTIAALLHKYNTLAFFDYATAAPYVPINMNPTNSTQHNPTYKDAVFLSCHKFVGGPGTPGVLVAKKALFVNPVPCGGGGGSVFYVTHGTHRYLKEIEVKEEGGTPDLIGAVRAGIVFQLKDNIGCDVITRRDEHLVKTANEYWASTSPNLILLGHENSNKLPIFSFVIRHAASGRLLHHNYVSVLLNDLFGIQSRGGCACAGPYAQQLLGMSEDVALEIENMLLEDQRLDRHHLRRHREYSDKEILRPGFTRLNLPYFYDDETVSFVLKAVHWISEHGWKLLPRYLFNPETGEWKYRNFQLYKDRKWIGSIKHRNGSVFPPLVPTEVYRDTYAGILSKADEVLVKNLKGGETCGDQTLLFGAEGEALRWFLLPCEAERILNDKSHQPTAFTMPFFPGREVTRKEGGGGSEVVNGNAAVAHYCSCSPLHMKMMNSDNSSDQNNSADNVMKEKVHDSINKGDGISNKIVKSEVVQNGPASDKTLSNGEPARDEKPPKKFTQENNEPPKSPTPSDEKPVLLCTLPRKQNKTTDSKQQPVNNPTEDVVAPILKFHNPPKQIFSLAVEGMEAFNMIENNDRVLLCLSGGKDSLSMLHVINQYKYFAKKKNIDFHIGAVTVDPQSAGYDPSPLKGKYLIGKKRSWPKVASYLNFCRLKISNPLFSIVIIGE